MPNSTHSNGQNPLHTFHSKFPIEKVANLLRTCYWHGKLSWHVRNKLATSHRNGIWKTTRHNGLLPTPTCYGFVADFLQGS